jgi:hypothetical protein
MSTKMRAKVGAIEIEFDGEPDFLRDEVPKLLKALSALAKEAPAKEVKEAGASSGEAPFSGGVQLTTNSIAAKLGVKSGSDLAIAAALELTRMKKKDRFSRQELLDSMKTANSYYRSTYLNNLSSTISRLIKDQRLLEPVKGHFSLSANELAALAPKVSAIA